MKQSNKQKPNILKDVKMMMYGFGDSENPRHDTSLVVQDYLIFYLKKILNKTKIIGKRKGKTKTDDLLFVIRHDKRKIKRIKELLNINVKLSQARRVFEFEEFEKDSDS